MDNGAAGVGSLVGDGAAGGIGLGAGSMVGVVTTGGGGGAGSGIKGRGCLEV